MEEIGAVHLAIPTGEFLEEGDTTLIEVRISGKLVYAAVSMPMGWYFVPSKKWLEKYAGEYLCWVAYENGNPAHPVVIGFRPNKNKTPGASYPDLAVFKTENARLEIDEKEGFWKQSYKERGIKQTEQLVLLGDTTEEAESKKESAVMGDTLVTFMEDFLKAVKAMVFQTNTGATIKLVNTPDFIALEKRLDTLKSKNVKLD